MARYLDTNQAMILLPSIDVAPTEQLAARLSDEMPDQLRVDPLAKLNPDVRPISRRICAIASVTSVANVPCAQLYNTSSYRAAMLRATTSKCWGQALDAVNGGRCSRRKRYRVLQLRCINDEDSRYAPGERPRSPT
jgi:hypothetical protein